MGKRRIEDLEGPSKKQVVAKAAGQWLRGEGEMARRIREFDWASTPLGPMESWSPALQTMVRIMLANRFPHILWWGPHYIQFYNDPYRPIPGAKHPEKALGRPGSECWSEIWSVIGPLIDRPFQGGPATWDDDILLEMQRHGFVEETHFTIAYSPVPDETVPSGIGGVLATVHEITEKVVGERRVVALRDLGARAGQAKTAEEACAIAAETLTRHAKDLPFALLYLVDADRKQARLAGAAGVAAGGILSPAVIALESKDGDNSPWPLGEVLRGEEIEVVADLAGQFGDGVPLGPWSDRPSSAVVVPIRSNKAHRLAGFLVAGVSARLRFDGPYRDFLNLVSSQVATAVANAREHEEERKRVEALAEIDRAKTAFFSNVSHEFRTPLTLMLGPVEDMLARSHTDLPPAAKGQLEVVNRNGLRLLRLVNTLLDFSRIEAGRVQAVFVPTDLAAFTSELASVFRAATERAGLGLVVDCPKLPEAVYVDRDMWEKIVLNLISNAFKFTLEGEIEVKLRADSSGAVLSVRDTGVGVPDEELSRIFERFHRVQTARSRTHEGSGIGLALVHELVKLHGGSIRAESRLGEGTTFIVNVPLGNKHLASGHLGSSRELASTAVGAAPFVEEALRWLPEAAPVEEGTLPTSHQELVPVPCPPSEAEAGASRPRIIVADDNADMRQYVARLLRERYTVEAVADGQAALAAARKGRPDLILSDVMMPNLDGFGLVRELRADAALKTIPIVLLSARAGEEARVEGLQHGADDYLIKPFSAREMMARVAAHLEMARMRKEAGEKIRESEERLRLAQAYGGVGVWGWNVESGQLTWEPEVERLYGLEAGTIRTYEDWASRVHPEDLARVGAERDAALSGRRPFHIEFRIRHAAGDERWIMARGRGEYDESGRLARVLGVDVDITERKRMEEALAETTSKAEENQIVLESVIQQMPAGIILTDASGAVAKNNEAMDKIWRRKMLPTENIGNHAYVAYCNDDREYQPEEWPLTRALRDGETVVGEEMVILRGDGTKGTVHVSAAPIKDKTGQIIAGVVVDLDITERKRAEEALRESEAVLRSFFDNPGAMRGIVEVLGDEEVRHVADNAVTGGFLGLTAEGMRGKLGSELGEPPEILRLWVSKYRESERTGKPVSFEYSDKRGKGEVWLEATVSYLGAVEGKPRFTYIVHDVTERKRAEEALRESEERFRVAQELSPDGFTILRPVRDGRGQVVDFTWVYANATAEGFMGKRFGELEGQRLLELFPGHGATEFWEKYRQVAETGERRVFEAHYEGETVASRWFRIAVVPAGGDIAVLAQDITERKQAEEALRQSRESFRALADNSPDNVDRLDRDSRHLYVNTPAARLFAVPPEEIIGKTNRQLGTPDPWAGIWEERVRQIFETGQSLDVEDAFPGKDGLHFWQSRCVPERAADGTVTSVLAVSRDITERKRAEEALRRSEEKFRRIFDSNMIGVAFWHADGSLFDANAAFCDLIGCTPEEVRAGGVRWSDVTPPEMLERDRKGIEEINATGVCTPYEKVFIHRDGQARTFIVGGAKLGNDRNEGVAFVVDITERKRAEQALSERARLLNLSYDAIMVRDAHDRITYWNKGAEEIYGHSRAEAVGQVTHELLKTEFPEPLESIRARLRQDNRWTGELTHTRRDGTRVTVASRWSLDRDAQGQPAAILESNTDITEQRKAEAAARESQDRLRLALDAAGLGVFDMCPQTGDLGWDKRTKAIWGMAESDMIDYSEGLQRLHPDDRERVARIVAETLKPDGSGNYEVEYRIVWPDGSIRWSAARARVYFEGEGANRCAVRMLGVEQDITERKRAEEALRESEERFRVAQELSPDGFSILRPVRDSEGRIVDFTFVYENAAIARINGTDPTAVVGRRLSEFLPAHSQSPFHEAHAHVADTGETCIMERKYDGGDIPRPTWFRVVVVRTGQDIAILSQDITERKRADQALRESEARFQTLADGTPVIIWVHDAAGGLRFVNRGYCEFFGVAIDQAIGGNWKPLVHPEDVPGYVDVFLKCHAEQREFHAQARVRRHDGQWRWIESFGAPRLSPGGEFLGMAGSSVDITERREAEAVLARDKEELEKLVAERTARLHELVGELEHFSYTITHDMRAPLRGMQGFAEMMAEACVGCERQDPMGFLRRIRTSGSRMDALITDALQYARAVRHELALAPVDVGALLRGMLDSYPELQPERARIELAGEIPLVMGNEAGLTQVFSNLLGNAVKFVKPGQFPEIRIWGEAVQSPKSEAQSEQSTVHSPQSTVGSEGSKVQDGDAGWVRIWVEDKGIGISDSMKAKVFDMFSRGHHTYEGTGIGLALVRKVVERMGGRVGVESEEGRGSRFWVELEAGEVRRRLKAEGWVLFQFFTGKASSR